MGKLIILACLIASSQAQGEKAVSDAKEMFGPVLCALNELKIPDDFNANFSVLIVPLTKLATSLTTNLNDIGAITVPNDPAIQKTFKSISTILEKIISNIEETVSEVRRNPSSSAPIFRGLRSILVNIIGLVTLFEKLIREALDSLSKGASDTAEPVSQVADEILQSVSSILGTLIDFSNLIPDPAGTFKSFKEHLLPIVERLVSFVDGGVGSPAPNGQGVGGLTSQAVGVIDGLLSDVVLPLVNSILPPGSSACGKAKNATDPMNNRTKVIRPSPEVICIPLKGTRPEMIETLNSSMGMPLTNVGVLLSSGTSGENADLGSFLDLLEPLLRLLQPTINMLREIPMGSPGSGLLNPVSQVLQSLLTTLSGRAPLDPEEIASRLLRTLVLLIGFTAVSSGGNPVLSEILRGILLSFGEPILSLLRKMDGSSGDLLQALSKTINSIGGSVEELIDQQPTVGGGGSDTGSSGGGGGLLGLVGGLLNGLLA